MASPSLIGKTALVTGSSKGIGRAIAQRLASAGASVIVTGRSLGNSQDGGPAAAGSVIETVDLIKAAGGSAIGVAADLEVAEDRARLMDTARSHNGGVDILVNNAGITSFELAAGMSTVLLERTINQYFRVPFLFAQALIPGFQKKGAGWIVNVGSVASLRPLIGRSQVDGDVIYGSCKAALARMTQGLALELLRDNIAVNLVAPSTAIRTPGGDSLIPAEFPTEDPAYLAETALHLCYLPADKRSGRIAYSMHFPFKEEIEVRSLDGKTVLEPKAPPVWSHPDIEPIEEVYSRTF